MKRIMSLVLILACLLWLTVPAAGAGTDLQTLVNRRDVAYSASSNIIRALGASMDNDANNF